LAKSLIVSFQYNIESVYFFYSNPVLNNQQGVTFQENSLFDRILLKQVLLLEIANRLEIRTIIVCSLLIRALTVGAQLAPTNKNFLQQARGKQFSDQYFIHSILCRFKTYYHNIFYVTYFNSTKLERRENFFHYQL
jgi:hypothetical protein